jgi:anti-sigma regulatory factor (Ser/Thr protein kinase)
MIRLLVIPFSTAEDVALGRYAVQAAHSTPGLVVALDAEGASRSAVGPRLVADVMQTTRGNGQSLAVIASDGAAGLLPEGPMAAPPVHRTLEDCLAAWTLDLGREDSLFMTLPARVDYIAPVRRFLVGLVRARHGDADAFPTEILVDELFLNAVENSPSDRNSFDVLFRCDGGELSMEVANVFDDTIDSARIMHRRLRSFDNSGDYLGERGRGLFLIARLADGLRIRSEPPDRIHVTVTRRLGRHAAVPGGGSDGPPEGR